ncbi:MAG: hypothetical protein KF893_22080 [Caldilineaceae bacterium]|nr:hypothetical protein [Caldilineaceae bacterium]
MITDHHESPPEPASLIALWFSALGGPLAWVLHNVGSYFVATVLCSVPGQELLLHALTVVLALVALGTALVGWRIRSRLKEMDWLDEYRISKGRAYFMASYGVISGILFWAVILAEGIPGFLIEPCLPPM